MKHADLISQMTLEEKVAFCSGSDYWHTASIERLGIPSILWSDGPHGIRNSVGTHDKDEPKKKDKKGEGMDALLGGVPAVCYPTAATTACSWDPELIYGMGELLGEECIAEKVSVLLGPGTNMKRSPLCGRNFEYFSEDPYLAGKMSAAFINGVQSKGIGTSLKHYAVNSQETRRMTVSAVVDERTLREIYLTAYEIAVKESQPWTIMCMYNRLNGVYGAENKWLLTDVLRHDFGFEGMIVTDWGAENDRVLGLLAGQNLEMPTSNGDGNRKIYDAVKRGEISENFLDEMVDGVVDVIMRAKEVLADGKGYNAGEHHAAARKIARESMVLLKNDDNILPLSKKAKVAVIGQMAKKPRHQGAGSSLVNSIKIDSAYNTMFEEGIDVIYADGYAMTKKEKKNSPETYIADAVEAAKKADVAVLFIGLTDEFESEGFDRTHLRIPPEHVALLSAIRGVTENIVVVLAGGAVVEMPWIGETKALLNSYLGGEASGSAVTDILFGDVNPSGKLAETYPFSLEDTPCYNNFPGHTATVEYREGLYIGYRYYDTAKKNVLFPFGFGMSYTTFEYSDLKVSADSIKDTDTLKVSFKIKNTGDRDGAEVAELYVAQENSTIFRPEKELKGFKKVFLKAGEEKEVEIELSKRAFAFYDVDLGDWHVETDNYKILVGASSRDIRLEGSVKVESTVDAPVKDLRETMPAYYSADVMNVPDDQFKALLGHEIPESEIHDYPNLTFANTLEDSACGKNGAKLCKLLRKFVGSDGMACSIALQTPVKNFVSMSMGVFSEELGHQLLDILNDKKPMGRGILVLIGKAIPAVVKGLPNLLKSI